MLFINITPDFCGFLGKLSKKLTILKCEKDK